MGNMVETAAQGRVARFRGDRCCCLQCSLKRDGSCSALCLFPDSFPQARILVALHDGICPMCINHVPSVFVLTTLPHYFFPCIHILFFSQLIEFSQYACPHVSVGWFGRFIFLYTISIRSFPSTTSFTSASPLTSPFLLLHVHT